jgi:hypothetical protein
MVAKPSKAYGKIFSQIGAPAGGKKKFFSFAFM